ncbi:Mitochondrial import receptor subunit TOM9-2 [Trifolium repens]|jgi:import receptor subunit TOM22|nr:mitochondrial import receptor subunit TOM9-2 [Trifolium repens]WJX18370.1 Mitochondrial import receptor subunit TOM9-2 [Trifolium repens]
MASQARKGGISLPNRPSNSNSNSWITNISRSSVVSYTKKAAADSSQIFGKLLKSTGKAAWITGTTFLVLVVPLIIEMDREQQLNDLELQQASILGTPPK